MRCRAGGFAAGGTIALWILVTRMAPPIAFTIPFFLAYRYLGCSTRVIGLVVIYLTFNLALVIWMMRPLLRRSAALAGGGGLDRRLRRCGRRFLRIILPLAGARPRGDRRSCASSSSWNDFFFALILTRTEAMTAPVAIVNFMQYEGWEWGRIAAGGTLVMLPVLVFTFFVRTYLVRGLTAGGVKE